MKIRALTTSSHCGEAYNANRLLQKKMEVMGMEEVRELLEDSVNATRAVRFAQGSWASGSAVNKVQVTFLSEKKRTDFFLRLLRFSANAYGCYCFSGKREWERVRHVELGFSGRLPFALDAAFLCIATADLAFTYADNFSSQRQNRLSGFMEGISGNYDYSNLALKEYEEAEGAAQMWFGVKTRRGRGPTKRKGDAFEEGRAAGEIEKGKKRKTRAIDDKAK